MAESIFLNIISRLRSHGEIVLHNYNINQEPEDMELLEEYLANEYATECLEYPNYPPEFSKESAVWSAKFLFRLAHFILYREQSKEEMESPFPTFKNNPDASEMLSADLCLRFVPILRKQLELISQEDILLQKLDDIMIMWPYSNVKNMESIDDSNLTVITENECLKTLMIDRIVENKNMKLAKSKGFAPSIKSYLSIFTKDYWPEYGEKY